MFERYTERARRVLFFARYEATQTGCYAIEPEHLLLGLLREGKGIAGRILERAGLSLDRSRNALGEIVPGGTPTNVEIPFSASTKRILQQTAAEADAMGHSYIGAEHLLLGIVHEQHSKAAVVLAYHGVTLDSVRADTRHALRDVEGETSHTPAVPPSTALRVSLSGQQGTSANRGPRHWFLEGFSFVGALSRLYGFPASRIEVANVVHDDRPLDLHLALRSDAGSADVERQMRLAFEEHFDVRVTQETKTTSTFVLSAPTGTTTAPLASATDGGSLGAISASSDSPPTAEQLRAFEAHVRAGRMPRLPLANDAGGPMVSGLMSMHALCGMLEDALGHPVVDETHLTGSYRIDLRSAGPTAEDLTTALRDQLGLALSPRESDVTFLVVRRR